MDIRQRIEMTNVTGIKCFATLNLYTTQVHCPFFKGDITFIPLFVKMVIAFFIIIWTNVLKTIDWVKNYCFNDD